MRAAGSRDADVANIVHRTPELLLVARHQIEALLADENLTDWVSAHRRLDCVLNIRSVDTKAISFFAIHHNVHIWLSEHAKQSEIGNAGHRPQHRHDFFALLLEVLQIGAKNLDRKLTLHAADGLLHVVGDRLGKSPSHAGNLFDFLVHGVDEQLFAAAELRAPLAARFEIDEVLDVEKAGRISSVVGAPYLRDDLRYFWEARENQTRPVHDFAAGRGTGARREGAARPN